MNQALPTLITLIVALVGSGGIVFGALRFNRDETGKTVTQHSQILADMDKFNKHLVDELERVRKRLDAAEEELEKTREERDRLAVIVNDCNGDVTSLNGRVVSMVEQIEDQKVHIAELESLVAELRGQPRD